ncbi:uncharacterized protein JN550_001724 [Neoarthrinium moseri]|uniref:uncharacterized protein n=1 Tax=Neoarthrinium moseri TaxID=1658444 RepID=UPI001FDB3F54|nr:uncharacterized protein JN550_001724 [Neoarthrinium moseri]KAI1876228.1 hypothetical protein JN550_001724 [Neoarthrinium moseri]
MAFAGSIHDYTGGIRPPVTGFARTRTPSSLASLLAPPLGFQLPIPGLLAKSKRSSTIHIPTSFYAPRIVLRPNDYPPTI